MDVQVIDVSNPLWLQTLKEIRHDIFHLPEYIDLEAKRTQATPEAILISEGDKLFFLPYLLRQCNNTVAEQAITEKIFDVASPSGYAGILLSNAAASNPEFVSFAISRLTHVLQTKGVCSAFFRLHPVLNKGLNDVFPANSCTVSGETVSINLKLTESEIWQQTKPNQRTAINKCKRLGFTARMVPFKEYIDDFFIIYEETIERVGGTKTYDYQYFMQLANALGDQLYLCIVELNHQVICAGLNTVCCGIVQGHVGGTKTTFLKQSPFSLMLDCSRLWAKKCGNEVLHLGGGVGASKDRVYDFKASFSQQRHPLLTLRLVIDPDKYFYLVKLQAKSLNTDVETLVSTNFFPAYRATKPG